MIKFVKKYSSKSYDDVRIVIIDDGLTSTKYDALKFIALNKIYTCLYILLNIEILIFINYFLFLFLIKLNFIY